MFYKKVTKNINYFKHMSSYAPPTVLMFLEKKLYFCVYYMVVKSEAK